VTSDTITFIINRFLLQLRSW